MSNTELIESVARELWRSDPRVSTVTWAVADPQLKSLYRILAAAAMNAAEHFNKQDHVQ
jgi:hypothetical protein